jgi:antitoxin FitA
MWLQMPVIGAKVALRSAGMPTIQVKNVPEDVHRILRARAADEGRSLQEHLLALLTEQARQPTLAEILDRAGSHSGGSVSFDEAVRLIREDRDSR